MHFIAFVEANLGVLLQTEAVSIRFQSRVRSAVEIQDRLDLPSVQSPVAECAYRYGLGDGQHHRVDRMVFLLYRDGINYKLYAITVIAQMSDFAVAPV